MAIGRPPRFSPEQRDAMRAVVRSDATERALRFYGRFSPESALAAVPWIGGEAGAEVAGAGPVSRLIASAGAIGAYGAKRAASAMTRGQAQLAEQLVRAQSPAGEAVGALQSLPSPFTPIYALPGMAAPPMAPAWNWAATQLQQ
jgi:hypothetical protein